VDAKRTGSNVVEKALQHFKGSAAEFARRLSEVAGEEVSRQRVHGWRLRGIFPRSMMVHIETLCRIPLDELVQAKPKERDAGNVVNRAIRFVGADATPADLAAKLTELSGRRITRQMVNGWQALEQFPLDVIPFIHMLTRIPVKDMVSGRGEKTRAPKGDKSGVRRQKRNTTERLRQ
jgi:hypothetical protein